LWKVVRYQFKWRSRSDAPSIIDAFVSSSEAATEEEVTHLIGRARAKTTVWKGKEKEDLSSQSRSSSVMDDIISTLKKLGISFTRAHMWKQYNKFREANTADMDAEELTSYQEALRLIKNDLNFVTQNAAEVQDENDE
jgi:DNA-binding LacI/PurR family transcriptional regulator